MCSSDLKKRIPKRKTAQKKTEAVDHSAVTTEGLEKDGWLKEDISSGKEREYSYPEVEENMLMTIFIC